MDVVNGSFETPLHHVCKHPGWFKGVCRCNIQLAHLLLQHGASSNAVTSEGDTPMHCIAKSTDFEAELAKLLLHNGAQLDARNGRGMTPLECAQAVSEANPSFPNSGLRQVLAGIVSTYDAVGDTQLL